MFVFIVYYEHKHFNYISCKLAVVYTKFAAPPYCAGTGSSDIHKNSHDIQ